jgi:hypothetical protein
MSETSTRMRRRSNRKLESKSHLPQLLQAFLVSDGGSGLCVNISGSMINSTAHCAFCWRACWQVTASLINKQLTAHWIRVPLGFRKIKVSLDGTGHQDLWYKTDKRAHSYQTPTLPSSASGVLNIFQTEGQIHSCLWPRGPQGYKWEQLLETSWSFTEKKCY